MKNRILSFIILAAGMVTSCNTDAEFSEFIPTHALSTLVKSATATCGSETVVGTVDNATHEIQFVFVNNSNFSDVAVTLEYATRAIRKEGAPAGERYRKFLSLGGSLHPIESLRVAGVDMAKPESVESSLAEFDRLVDKYLELTAR